MALEPRARRVLVDAGACAPSHESEADYAEHAELAAPLTLAGEVVHGFRRGSKEIGVPTANLEAPGLLDEVAHLATGVYYGWASIEEPGRVRGPYKMVMSLGWCARHAYAHTAGTRTTPTQRRRWYAAL
jgi:hypothetical protein